MKVMLTSPCEGEDPGTTVDVLEGRGRWLLANGYANDPKDDSSQLRNTSVEAAVDPTLAENREAPGEKFKQVAHRSSKDEKIEPGED